MQPNLQSKFSYYNKFQQKRNQMLHVYLKMKGQVFTLETEPYSPSLLQFNPFLTC